MSCSFLVTEARNNDESDAAEEESAEEPTERAPSFFVCDDRAKDHTDNGNDCSDCADRFHSFHLLILQIPDSRFSKFHQNLADHHNQITVP